MMGDRARIEIPKDWNAQVKPFMKANNRKATWQLLNTLIPYFGLLYLMYLSLDVSYALTLPLGIIGGLLTMRIFIFTHDCGHGSFTTSKKANAIIGFISGVLSFTPHKQWCHEHSLHHATSGTLEEKHRGVGYLTIRTLDEYQEMSPGERRMYRLYRSWPVLFLIGPLYVFLVEYRFPKKGATPRDRSSVIKTNLGMVAYYAVIVALFGFWNTIAIITPIAFTASIMGVWFFYVQHHHEDAYWEQAENWDFASAAVNGSSFYKVNPVLQWFSGNIGFHHIHHLCPRVANYHLERCHEGVAFFQQVRPFTSLECLHFIGLDLWDEGQKKLIPFKEAPEVLLEKVPIVSLDH